MFKHDFTRSVLLYVMPVLVALAAVSMRPVGVAQADTMVSGRVAGSDTSTLVPFAGYGKPNHSRVWYNSSRARWDALVPKNDGGGQGDNHYIMKDVAGSQIFTSVQLENRDSGRPDAFWDDANKKLYVLGSHSSQSLFWQVNYDATSDTYSINPQVNAVRVPGLVQPPGNDGSNEPAALYVSPNGRVWVAAMLDGQLNVQQSVNGGATWRAQPINLDTTVRVGLTVWVHFTAQGVTYMGLFAGEDGDIVSNARFYYWYIAQGADPGVLANWTNDSARIPAPVGLERADDHVSSEHDDAENQYFAVKTKGGAPTDPAIKLYKRTADGTWSQYTVTTTQEVPEQSRPSLVLDKDAGVLHVYTNDTGGGDGKMKQASLSALGSLVGAPFTVLFSKSLGAFDNLITPRQAVNAATSGIVLLAHNASEDTVWFNAEGAAVPEITSGRVAGSDTSTLAPFAGYGKPNLSRVWYNSSRARWDALIPKNDGGGQGDNHYIMKDVSGSQIFTSVQLENRDSARPDAFWDDANKKLYVLGSHSSQSLFWQVNYDATSDTYSINPQVNAVRVPGLVQPPGNDGSNDPTPLYVSPNGRVWVAAMLDGQLNVQQSTNGGATWRAQPINLDTTVLMGLTVWVHFTVQGVTYMGLFAGENAVPGVDTRNYYWYIAQGADPGVLTNWTNDSPNIPPFVGSERADDHVSSARDDAENQYFAVKTEGGAPTDPLIKLYKRTAAGVWSQYTVTMTQEVPEQTRPSLVLDKDTATLHVYTTDTGDGDGKMKQASLSALGSLPGAPFTVLLSKSLGTFNNIITPRQAVNAAASGIVITANNTTEQTVWFNEESAKLFLLAGQ